MPRLSGFNNRKAKFVDRDRGYRELMKLMRSPNFEVIVGVVGDEAAAQHTEAGIPVGELAAIHEFGLGNVPPRPFMRFGFDKRRRLYARQMEQVFRTTNNRGQLGPKLVKFGRGIAADIRKDVRTDSLGLERLKRATVEAKGHGVPLVDTGELTGAITARVVRR